MTINQNPEQVARDRIDEMLSQAGWAVQSKDKINFIAAKGIVIQQYTTSVGPADYVLFVNQKPVGIIEAKKEDEEQYNALLESIGVEETVVQNTVELI